MKERSGWFNGLFPQRTPWFLVGDFHSYRPFNFGRGKDREKIECLRAGVERAVDNSRGKIDRITRSHDALFLFDPLLGGAGEYVEDFFHLRMVMEIVRFAWRELCANEHQVGVRHHAGLAVPVMRLAGQVFDFRLAQRNDAPWSVRCRHAVDVFSRRRWRQGFLGGQRGFREKQRADRDDVFLQPGGANDRAGLEGIHQKAGEMLGDRIDENISHE